MRSRDTHTRTVYVRDIEVRSITDITPRMRRIVFGGPGLGSHEHDGVTIAPFESDGFDDDVRLIFPHPETGDRPAPNHRSDGKLEWTPETKELFRAYTVRRWDPHAGDDGYGELTIDFARHADGLAEAWSRTATVGKRLWAAGPKMSANLPTHRDWLLLVGDETALPAIGRALEEVAAQGKASSVPVRAFIEIGDLADLQSLPRGENVDVCWVLRDEARVQNMTGAATADAQIDCDHGDVASAVLAATWPEGRGYAWIAGESGRIRPLRAGLAEGGFASDDVEITGYWRDPAAVGERGQR